MKLTFVIPGAPRTKKNHGRTRYSFRKKRNVHVPSEAYESWASAANLALPQIRRAAEFAGIHQRGDPGSLALDHSRTPRAARRLAAPWIRRPLECLQGALERVRIGRLVPAAGDGERAGRRDARKHRLAAQRHAAQLRREPGATRCPANSVACSAKFVYGARCLLRRHAVFPLDRDPTDASGIDPRSAPIGFRRHGPGIAGPFRPWFRHLHLQRGFLGTLRVCSDPRGSVSCVHMDGFRAG